MWTYLPGNRSITSAEDVFKKLECSIVAGAVDAHLLRLVAVEGPARATVLGIRQERRAEWPGMSISGTIVDVSGLGIGDDLADVVLGVEAAVAAVRSDAVLSFGFSPYKIPFRQAPISRELGISLDLEPPAHVVAQVPMEND